MTTEEEKPLLDKPIANRCTLGMYLFLPVGIHNHRGSFAHVFDNLFHLLVITIGFELLVQENRKKHESLYTPFVCTIILFYLVREMKGILANNVTRRATVLGLNEEFCVAYGGFSAWTALNGCGEILFKVIVHWFHWMIFLSPLAFSFTNSWEYSIYYTLAIFFLMMGAMWFDYKTAIQAVTTYRAGNRPVFIHVRDFYQNGSFCCERPPRRTLRRLFLVSLIFFIMSVWVALIYMTNGWDKEESWKPLGVIIGASSVIVLFVVAARD